MPSFITSLFKAVTGFRLLTWWVTGCVCVIGAATVQAKQLYFSKDALSYRYQWQAAGLETQYQLQFSLSVDSFKLSKFKAYRHQNSTQYVERELRLHIKQYDPALVRFSFEKQAEGLEVRIHSKNKTLLSQVRQELANKQYDALSDYLDANYYMRFYDQQGAQVIKPDHKRIMQESLLAVRPISDAFAELAMGLSRRDFMERVLSFVQSIPYNRLQSWDGLRGAGFIPPAQLIAQNRGDCDSKSTLMAAIIKNRYPDLPMALIFVPGHALLGLNIPPKADDKTLRYKGVTYVLMEPTGPQILPLGQLAKLSNQYIASDSVIYELL